jgi:hypothetical protein
MTTTLLPDGSDLNLTLHARLTIRLLNVVNERAKAREEIKTARTPPEED